MRQFRTLTLAVLLLIPLASLHAEAARVEANCVTQVALASAKTYANPFMQVELDAVVTRPDGKQLRVPAFWAGGNDWRFRYASDQVGTHTWRTECTDAANSGLHRVTGKIEVVPYRGENPLLKHGPIGVAKDQRHFAHADGSPFFWLGDTWWKCLSQRMTWEGFQELTADRKKKGFSVVQIVCGPYPDEQMMEPRWENEGGMPYLEKDFSVVNPAYFEFADRRLKHLVEAGIVPAIVGGWGRPQAGGRSTLEQVGLDGFKRHWRNLVARYGAHPVVWILGGEAKDAYGPWSELAKYLKETDSSRHPLCYHSPGNPRQAIRDNSSFDFDMVGIGHDGFKTAAQSLSLLNFCLSQQPMRPALCGEACYEGHMQTNFQDIQRHLFWSFILSGAAGHTYGAAGIWQASVEGNSGIDPIYDWTTWREGMNYPGSAQLGLGKKLLEQYPWSRFEPHPEWTETNCIAAGIPGEVRFIYQPRRKIYDWKGTIVKQLEPGVRYAAFYFDPATGRRFDLGTIEAPSGEYQTKGVPSPQDWVLVLKRNAKN